MDNLITAPTISNGVVNALDAAASDGVDDAATFGSAVASIAMKGARGRPPDEERRSGDRRPSQAPAPGLRPTWFPDWRDGVVAIVASGPSTKLANVAQLRGRTKVIAVKENVELCPWADVVYGCDVAFWRNAMGLPNFTGLRVAYKSPSSLVHSIRIAEKEHRILVEEPGVIGSGRNSGFQALNLAIQFGAKRILLIGFDMSDRHGVHWYGRSQGDGRSQPAEWNFVQWRKAFHAAACQMAGLGVQVLNASPLTTLTCFPVVTIESALKEWRI